MNAIWSKAKLARLWLVSTYIRKIQASDISRRVILRGILTLAAC